MHQDLFPPTIVVLTGAGISKESGIDTFRDADGLWTRVNLEEVATIEAWHRDKKKVLDFYNDTRRQFRAAHIEPNAAHRALARLEKEYPASPFVSEARKLREEFPPSSTPAAPPAAPADAAKAPPASPPSGLP